MGSYKKLDANALGSYNITTKESHGVDGQQ